MRSMVPVPRVATAPALLDVTVVPPVRVKIPVGVSVGALPPLLSIVRPERVLLPTRVTVELPFMVRT